MSLSSACHLFRRCDAKSSQAVGGIQNPTAGHLISKGAVALAGKQNMKEFKIEYTST